MSGRCLPVRERASQAAGWTWMKPTRPSQGPIRSHRRRPRPPGVHLHWAMPDALLRGALADPSSAHRPPASGPSAAGGGVGMAALPDRWLVLRLLAPAAGAGTAVSRGWVLDAATGRAWDLVRLDWRPPGRRRRRGAGNARRSARRSDRRRRRHADMDRRGTTPRAAGSPFTTRSTTSNADPALGGTLPGGPVAERATYTVVGWWSRGDLDPLDEIRGTASLDRRLADLGWTLQPGTDTAAAPPRRRAGRRKPRSPCSARGR